MPQLIDYLENYTDVTATVLAKIDSPGGNYPRIRGIYFLLDGSVCRYIGQSVDIINRAYNHHRNGRIFDRVFVVLVSHAVSLDMVERAFIRVCAPPDNRQKYGSGDRSEDIYYLTPFVGCMELCC
jgi:hypothetical protein